MHSFYNCERIDAQYAKQETQQQPGVVTVTIVRQQGFSVRLL